MSNSEEELVSHAEKGPMPNSALESVFNVEEELVSNTEPAAEVRISPICHMNIT